MLSNTGGDASPTATAKLTRREFLKAVGFSTLSTLGLGLPPAIYSASIEPTHVEVKPVSLILPRLDPAFDGFKLVQLSDIHFDNIFMTKARFHAWLTKVIDQRPDMVAITGDFVTDGVAPVAKDLQANLSQLAAAVPTVAILGNHDHWTDPDAVRDILEASGVQNICNTRLTLERDSALLHLCGVDDVWEQQHRMDLVLSGLPDAGAAILLAHEPDYADESALVGRFDLQLSGHSHGGQVILPWGYILVKPSLALRYPIGQYQVGSMIQYTNRGLGMVRPRVRFNCRPEITVFTLKTPPR